MRVLYVILVVLSTIPWLSEAQDFRTLDGKGNNLNNPQWGAAGSTVPRITSIGYSDGYTTPGTFNNAEPRVISNQLFDQAESINDQRGLSACMWVFGQFIDHDITLVENGNEFLPITVPADDEVMQPGSVIPMTRSKIVPGSGTEPGNPRMFVNEITSFIDGSVIYGSGGRRSEWLRSFKDGKLKVSSGDLLPWNTTTGEFDGSIDQNAPPMADDVGRYLRHFVAGDVRANENPLLIAFHTIFVREHNRMCDELKIEHPGWSDAQLYEMARKNVGGQLQSIVYYEWLPAMGIEIEPYSGYNENINPGITNVFSAAAFRLGHTLLNGEILRMGTDGQEVVSGNMLLRDGFFNPVEVLRMGIDPYFKGMGMQVQQQLDCKMVDEVRNFLFFQPGNPFAGLDLAAININRGRERGLADYNTVRSDFGLHTFNSFQEINDDDEVIRILQSLYGSVDQIDPWVGMLSERHEEGAMMGQLLINILTRQFTDLRDGDRYYFENDPMFSQAEIERIRSTTLQDIILRNSGLECMQDGMFWMVPHEDISCWPAVATRHLDMSIAPNPIVSEARVNLYSTQNESATLKLVNSFGRVVMEENLDLQIGENYLTLNLSNQQNTGIYLLIVEMGDDYHLVKILKN